MSTVDRREDRPAAQAAALPAKPGGEEGRDALAHAARQHRTLWRDAMGRLLQNKLAMFGAIIILLILVMAVFAPLIATYAYDEPNYAAITQHPSREFPFGTDQLGRDMFSRMIYGARISMLVGLGAQVIIFLIGVPIGAVSGYAGGKIDSFLMRFVDVMYAFPRLLFVILIMSALGPGLMNIFIAIGLTGWVLLARLTRAEFLTMREEEYILAARAAGAGHWRMITKHMLPNALTPIIVTLTFGIPLAIFTEASLSFIGVGITPPTPSWGQMVGEFFPLLQGLWFLSVIPAIAIALVMMGFTFFGDGLRDALDPRMQRRV